jgi:hypothetical protein
VIKVLIPGDYKIFTMLFNHPPKLRQLVTSESPRLRQHHWIQPELGVFFGTLDVNMTWLMSLSTEKEKPKAAYAQYFGHPSSVSSEVHYASVEGVLMANKLRDRCWRAGLGVTPELLHRTER